MAALEFEQIQTHLKLGRRSQQRAQLSRAAHHYQQVLSLDAAQPQAHQGLAQLYQRWGEIDLASQHYQAAFASSSSLGARFYFDAAMLYAEQHRYGWAAACYRQAIACKPDFLAAYLNLGDVLIRQGATEDVMWSRGFWACFWPRSRCNSCSMACPTLDLAAECLSEAQGGG